MDLWGGGVHAVVGLLPWLMFTLLEIVLLFLAIFWGHFIWHSYTESWHHLPSKRGAWSISFLPIRVQKYFTPSKLCQGKDRPHALLSCSPRRLFIGCSPPSVFGAAADASASNDSGNFTPAFSGQTGRDNLSICQSLICWSTFSTLVGSLSLLFLFPLFSQTCFPFFGPMLFFLHLPFLFDPCCICISFGI